MFSAAQKESLLPLLFKILAALDLGYGVGSWLLCAGFLVRRVRAFSCCGVRLWGFRASVIAAPGLCSASSCEVVGAWAQLLHVMWNLP